MYIENEMKSSLLVKLVTSNLILIKLERLEFGV